jgi:hypothetical protein
MSAPAQPPRRRRGDAVAAITAVMATLLAAALVGRAPDAPPARTGVGDSVQVEHARLGCPQSPGGESPRRTVLAVSPQQDQEPTGNDRLVLTAAADRSSRLTGTDTVGTVVRQTDRAGAPVLVSASGALAVGTSAAQFVSAETGQRSGLEALGCPEARAQWWFTGIDTGPDATSRLVLANPTPAATVVTVRFFGPRGVVEVAAAQGIPVGGGTSRVIDLAGYAPELDVAAVHVQATRGRIAAALHVERRAGLDAAGAEWIAPAADPSREPVVVPLPGGAGHRTLVVTNPSAGEALVSARVVDEEGAFVPSGLDGVRVGPGRTLSVDLDPAVDRSAAAVALSSNVPVLAATGLDMRQPVDFVTVPTAAHLDGLATVPVLSAADSSLALVTLRAGGGRVLIRWFDGGGDELGRERLAVPGARTTTWPIPGRGRAEVAYLTVQPEADLPVYVTAASRSRAGIAALPLEVRRQYVDVPGLVARP